MFYFICPTCELAHQNHTESEDRPKYIWETENSNLYKKRKSKLSEI